MCSQRFEDQHKMYRAQPPAAPFKAFNPRTAASGSTLDFSASLKLREHSGGVAEA